jgi:hypothetical protein
LTETAAEADGHTKMWLNGPVFDNCDDEWSARESLMRLGGIGFVD